MKSYVGIDWSEKRHDVRIHNAAGACIDRFAVPHDLAGFRELDSRLRASNPNPAACLVAIETHDNLLVDFLSECGYTLYVVAPTQVAFSRRRQRPSGAKDDDHDTEVLAELLRTDVRRLLPWHPDGALVRQLRVHLSGLDDLTKLAVAQHNRLRAGLLRAYPQALVAFTDLKAQVTLAFLQAFPSPQAVADLSWTAFAAFFRQRGYSHPRLLPAKYAQLTAPQPVADAPIAAAWQVQTAQLAQHLAALLQQKKATTRQVQQLFQQHPDAFIFDSVPGAGEQLAPKLLTIFGDQRNRYPLPTILPAIAGTCPITIQSGRSRRVVFRRACNRRYRQTLQQLARCSVLVSPWAASYFQRVKARGHGNSHAYRCLANRWLRIIWTLWQKRVVYDEQYHWQQVQRHRRPVL